MTAPVIYGRDIQQIAKSIAVPLKEWAGNCRPICEKILDLGLIEPECKPRLVNGHWKGPIEPSTMYAERNEPIRHTWIEFEYDGSTYVMDPTRYVFEGADYDIHVGHKLNTEYAADEDEIAYLAAQLDCFMESYKDFRKSQGLADCPPNPLEIMNGFADKVGRIARLVKHNHRNDPKPDWEVTMEKELAGVFNYILMCAAYHGLDFPRGFQTELSHALDDHGGNRVD